MWLGKYFGKYTIKISHGILKKNLNSSVGFYLDFFHLFFSLESPSLALSFDHKDWVDVYLFSFSNLFS